MNKFRLLVKTDVEAIIFDNPEYEKLSPADQRKFLDDFVIGLRNEFANQIAETDMKDAIAVWRYRTDKSRRTRDAEND